MADNEVVIIDYGMGNLWSVASAVKFLGFTPVVTSDISIVSSAESLILPGVGSFRRAMQEIKSASIDQAIFKSLKNPKAKLLGICLGMQVLFESSEEAPDQKGLGILSGSVRKLEADVRIPHMGWNTLEGDAKSALCSQQAGQFAYFAHSYFCPVSNATVRSTTHGSTFSSVIENENVFGVQFHPEKSGALGLSLLQKFVAL